MCLVSALFDNFANTFQHIEVQCIGMEWLTIYIISTMDEDRHDIKANDNNLIYSNTYWCGWCVDGVWTLHHILKLITDG